MQRANLAQHAVDAVADAQKILLRLKMDVGSTALHGICEQCVNQTHHWLAVSVGTAGNALIVNFASFDFMQDAVNRQLMAEILVNRVDYFGFACQQGYDLERNAGARDQHGAQLVECHHVRRIRQSH